MPSLLPRPRPDQTYVSVSALDGGQITLSDHFFVHPATPGASRTVPSLAFLITHPGPTSPVFDKTAHPYHLLFDLGLRKSASLYPPATQQHLANRQPQRLGPGVAAQLSQHGIPPASIAAILLSHTHYDHHGDPSDFPTTSFVVGHGSLSLLAHGLPSTASHQRFEPDLFAGLRTHELPAPSAGAPWKPLGPFPAALDLFGDASVYVLDCPGHLPGHVNLLCRLGPNKWVVLCGDAFHDRRLVTGEREVGTWTDEAGATQCIHVDKEGAERSIATLRGATWCGGAGVEVELVAAHDEVWAAKNAGAFLPGRIE